MSQDSSAREPGPTARRSLSFKVENVFTTWQQSLEWAAIATERFVYRGQKEDWELQTHLDREFRRLGIKGRLRIGTELNLIREFRRKYAAADSAAVVESVPYALAMMRHDGAPTRLLDWTYSRFIALFFALRDARPFDGGRRTREALESEPTLPTVWCANVDFLAKPHQKRPFSPPPDRADATFVKTFLNARERRVAMVNSYLLSERLQLQQGAFMASTKLDASFQENLLALGGATKAENVCVFKFALDAAELRKALVALWRMNLSDAALFPGLDGFCRSFSQRICLFANDAVYQRLGVIEGLRPREWRTLRVGGRTTAGRRSRGSKAAR